MWDVFGLCEAVAAGLRRKATEVDLEQAVHGLDALSEVELHPIIAEAFSSAGFGVIREQPYPSPGTTRKRSDRERCDIVLTPTHPARLADPVEEQIEQERAAGTLFAGALGPAPAGIEPEEAYWLEVKVVGQFCLEAGITGQNRSYTSELIGRAGPIGDIRKLARDKRITHAGVLVVLFAADRATAEHDAAVLVHRCIDRDLPVRSPELHGFEITDRIGNGLCMVIVIPLKKGRI